MQRFVKGFSISLLFVAGIFMACNDGGGTPSAGDSVTFTADSVSFKMIYVSGGHTFPVGVDDNGDMDGDGGQDIAGGEVTVTDAYWIGETELTWELWSAVYIWASGDTDMDGIINGAEVAGTYSFDNFGLQGGNTSAVAHGTNQQPVSRVNWRDSIVWCNALTEWYNFQNSTNYTCVYTYDDGGGAAIIRDSQDSNATACDGAVASSTASGFRLLTGYEWELAARWRGNDTTNTVSGYNAPSFTKGNSLSGSTTFYNDQTDANPVNGTVDGREANDLIAVYHYYWDTGLQDTGVDETAEVKSKNANTLGLYDMSGNVYEWIFDLSGADRIRRGGTYRDRSDYLQIGQAGLSNSGSIGAPGDIGTNVGMRIGRSNL